VKPSLVRELIREIITETIVENNNIQDVKGKAVDSVQVNDSTMVIHFDDSSTLTVQTTSPDQKIQYQFNRGMIKPQPNSDPTPGATH
jgi:hypothetical protein